VNQAATEVLEVLTEDRVLSIVRAPRIDDVVALTGALAAGGIRVLELTFTTPGLSDLLSTAAASAAQTGTLVGAGTVTSGEQATAAVEAGARFIVTPGLGPYARDIVDVAHSAGAAVVLGALTPSEVITAVELGADVVKIFPARAVGPSYLSDLHGPLPGVPLVPSGGVSIHNAAEFLAAGALAVTAGTSVVAPSDVEQARWSEITENATAFCNALGPRPR